MILGLIAGGWLRAVGAARSRCGACSSPALAGLALGGLLHVTGICPVVKRIWTPSWTLFSGGWCFLLLAAFCWVIETRGYRSWAFPLVVIGLNSIAAYLIAHLFEDFIASVVPDPPRAGHLRHVRRRRSSRSSAAWRCSRSTG